MKRNLFTMQKKKWKFLVLLLLLLGCEKSTIERNPYLPEMRFQATISLNLPQYDALRFTGGTALLPQFGHKGVVVFNLNGNTFLAWEASCPNHLPKACSQTQLEGVLVQCRCEGYRYSLATGQLLNPPEGDDRVYPLINYLIEQRGTNLIISN
ncbi:MAG: Rieske (2Fe-2S) protein [Flavobacteriaceae bacterium]